VNHVVLLMATRCAFRTCVGSTFRKGIALRVTS